MTIDFEKVQLRREEDFREQLMRAVAVAGRKQRRQAKVDPADLRFMRSAHALARVSTALRLLPLGHADLKFLRWQRLALPYAIELVAKAQADFIASYGLESATSDEPEGFLRALHAAIKSAAGVSDK